MFKVFISLFFVGLNVFAEMNLQRTKTDYLFVVDTSQSMTFEKVLMQRIAKSFSNSPDLKKADFRLMVTTMDMPASGGKPVGNTAYVDKSMANWKNEIISRMTGSIGTGAEAEKGFESAWTFIKNYKQLFRTDAVTQIIFISTEDDASLISVKQFANFLRQFNRVTSHFVGVTELGVCVPKNPAGQFIEVGAKYMDLSQELAGKSKCIYTF